MKQRSRLATLRDRVHRRRRQSAALAGVATLCLSIGVVVTTTSADSGANLAPQAVAPSSLAPTSSRVSPVLARGAHLPTVPTSAVTVSPEPGSRTADPKTQISFLGRPASALGSVTVVGSISGRHAGHFVDYSTGNGASFVPDRPFVAGETVTVHTSLPIVGASGGAFHFTVAHVLPVAGTYTVPPLSTTAPQVNHFASAPALAAPQISVTSNRLTTTGDFFLAPKGNVGKAGPMIVSPSGQLVWFNPLSGTRLAFDLNVQSYENKPVLTWFQGRVIAAHGEGVGIIMNEHYHVVAVIHGGNGTAMDLHEFQLTPEGTALITAYRTLRWDTTPAGGIKDGAVFDGVVQEIDIKTGAVMLEWDSLDHVGVGASNFRAPTSPGADFDYFHVNAIQQLKGGLLLVSGRNTSAAYEIDPADAGAVVFRLGGKFPTVPLSSGARFWYQHDVELHRDGTFTVFDDGAGPAREPASRALTLALTAGHRHVKVIHAYTNPGVLAAALGNLQQLSNGDEVVGWGTAPSYSVLSSDGAVLYEASMPSGDDSYRAYLHDWTGRPTTRPALARAAGGRLAMSWNGETGIARWKITFPNTTRAAVTVPATGFETLSAPLSGHGSATVVALSSGGATLGTSAPLRF